MKIKATGGIGCLVFILTILGIRSLILEFYSVSPIIVIIVGIYLLIEFISWILR